MSKQQKILIADDEEYWIKRHVENLRGFGITDIVTADDAETAEKIIDGGDLSAALIDGFGGDWGGLVTAAQQRGTRVILISSRDEEDDGLFGQQVAEIGAEYINKDKFESPGFEQQYEILAEDLKVEVGGSKEAPVI